MTGWKVPEADVERHAGDVAPAHGEAPQQRVGDVQTRGRGAATAPS